MYDPTIHNNDQKIQQKSHNISYQPSFVKNMCTTKSIVNLYATWLKTRLTMITIRMDMVQDAKQKKKLNMMQVQ